MCTVSRQLRRAASDTAVSGVAAAKLPPRPRNADARPSRIARIASTVSCPDAIGTVKPSVSPKRGCPRRRMLHDAHRPVTLHIGVSTYRAEAGAGTAEHAAQQLDVHDLADGCHRVALLGQPHRPAHDRRWRVREQPRHERDLGPGQAGRRLHSGPIQRGQTRRVLFEALACKRRETPCLPRPTRPATIRSPGTAPYRRRPGSAGSGRRVRCLPPTRPRTDCGLRNFNSPASGSGFTATITAPLRLARSSAVSIRGWLVPGFCPTTTSSLAAWMSSSVTLPLPTPIVWVSARPDDSWHMLEQSGRLFVPYARASSCHRNAASLEVRPDV